MVHMNKKGQFFIIMLLFMAVIVAEVAVFTTESKQLQRQLALPPEPGVESDMSSYTQELRAALEGEVYSGQSSYIETVISDLEGQAAQSGKNLDIQCTEGQTGDTYSLDCDLTLTTSTGTYKESFYHEFTVVTSITTYNDENYLNEDRYFTKGETVYYELTSNDNTKDYNVTLHNSTGSEFFQENMTTTKYQNSSEFTMSSVWPDGAYEIRINGTKRADIYYNYVTIKFTTKDALNEEATQFQPGDTVNWELEMGIYDGSYLDTAYGVNIYHADGKASGYDIFGETVSGFASGSFMLSTGEEAGIMNIVITDLDHGQSDTTYIEVVAEEPSGYIAAVIPFNEPHNEVWVPGTADSGYTEWYDTIATLYESIPFTVGITGDDTLRVDGSEWFGLPRVKASKIHILTASVAPEEDCA